ncbi:UbiX family flavin prenyltransferase [Anaerostipes sp.]|uniref:UbiX family flavin prenyltransferase n=1 Tax=Anaerostipes sp. TaxID=1872530 RepID=UPI0025BB7BBA|nr:UbiX family flavin prenyltransferase [Anaerostipes sp.]MBS7008792.1 UbiX family flavin prenyltransferase [Anaerostipes sp.]
MDKKRLAVGISGASGMPIAAKLLQTLKAAGIETHLIYTDSAAKTFSIETGLPLEEFCSLAHTVYDNRDIGAAPASGSYPMDGMIVVPCSMKTLAGIYSGYSDNLLLRAADVTLKERRKLVLVTRECPLSNIHLRNMYEVSQAGAVILPPVLSYYNHPQSVEDMTKHITGKILDQFGIIYSEFQRWEG